MITGNRIFEARELLDMAQSGGGIFGQTAKGITHWMDRYADYRTAWHIWDSSSPGDLGRGERRVHYPWVAQTARNGHCHWAVH